MAEVLGCLGGGEGVLWNYPFMGIGQNYSRQTVTPSNSRQNKINRSYKPESTTKVSRISWKDQSGYTVTELFFNRN